MAIPRDVVARIIVVIPRDVVAPMELVIIAVDVVAPMCVMAHWGVMARLDVVTAMTH